MPKEKTNEVSLQDLKDWLDLEKKAREEFEHKVLNRLDIHQRTLASVDSDRQIIEDVVRRLGGVEEGFKLLRDYLTRMAGDLKYEVQLGGEQVSSTVKKEIDTLHDIVQQGTDQGTPVTFKEKKPLLKRVKEYLTGIKEESIKEIKDESK